MNTNFYFELQTPTKPTREETMLLYALGEELLLTKQFVNSYHKLSTDTIRIGTTNCGDATRALARIYNALRTSKNYMAHICSVTII